MNDYIATPYEEVLPDRYYEVDSYLRPKPFKCLVLEKGEIEAKVLLSNGDTLMPHCQDVWYELTNVQKFQTV